MFKYYRSESMAFGPISEHYGCNIFTLTQYTWDSINTPCSSKLKGRKNTFRTDSFSYIRKISRPVSSSPLAWQLLVVTAQHKEELFSGLCSLIFWSPVTEQDCVVASFEYWASSPPLPVLSTTSPPRAALVPHCRWCNLSVKHILKRDSVF
jgi:hypothetical protein